MVSLNSSSAKGERIQSALQAFLILFWVQVCRTIKRDVSLGGLRKIEYSSIKIKYKDRHKITSRTLRYSLWTFGSRKSQREQGVPAVESPDVWCWKSWRLLTQPQPACASSPIGSPNGSREFWVPEVSAPSESLDTSRLSRMRTFARQKSQWESGVPNVGSPDTLGLSPLARLCIGSPNKSRKSQLPEVPGFYREFLPQLC